MNWITAAVAATGHDATAKATTAAAVTSGAASLAVADIALTVFGVPGVVLFAGFAGAAIALRFLPEISRWGMFTSVGSGTIISGYSAEALVGIAKHFGLSIGLTFSGFVVGLLANAALAFIFTKGASILNKKLGGSDG